MQLYKINYQSNTDQMARWCGSQTDAAKTRAELRSAGHKVIDTKTVDVPTAKGPLLAWLNENARA